MANPPKLNQVIAIEKGVKTRVYGELSEAHKALQKEELFKGHAKIYRPKDDDPTKPTGEQLPEDHKKIQAKAEDIIRQTSEKLTELFDVSAMRDWGNCIAKADVVVRDKVIIKECPVAYLLFLEKQLNDLHTFVKKLPTLDPSENWDLNREQALYSTRSIETVRTKKIVRPLVMYEATKEHPAQVKEVTEDVLAGTWSTIKYSSALPAERVNELVKRVEDLQKAVKFAREQANSQEVAELKIGKAFFEFLFA